MVLINLKVKTLDNRNDSVILIDDESTLSDFRDEVERLVEVPKVNQRLIFRGKVLLDDSKTLRSYGLEDDYALHLVTRPPDSSPMGPPASAGGPTQPSADELQQQTGTMTQIINSHFIVGNMPFERTRLFSEPDETMITFGNVIDQLIQHYHLEFQPTLVLNRPQNDDFSINVYFRGHRDRIVNSPARERLEHLRVEFQGLSWLCMILRTRFCPHLNELFNSGIEPSQETAYRIIADILQTMHQHDYFNEDELRAAIPGQDPNLIELIDQLKNWNFTEDDAHLERRPDSLTMRHCTSDDVVQFLQYLSRIDAYITEHLMPSYLRALTYANTGGANSSSYSSRLINCFSSAFSRMQHLRSHIYHMISDLGIHADNNEMHRIYPQYLSYNRREEPPIADISFLFFHPRNSDRSHAATTMPSLRQLSEQRRASSSNQIQRRPAAHQLLSYPIGGIRGIILPSILQAAAAAENDHQGPSIDSGSSTINELTEGQRRGYSRIVDTLTDYITENRIGPQPANFTEIFSSNMPNENIQNAIRYIRQHQQAAQTQQEPPVESNGEGGPSIRLVNPFGGSGSGGVLFGPSASTSTGGGGGTPTGSFSITITTRDGSPPQNNGTSEARTSFPEYTGVHFVPMDQGVGNSQQQQIPTASSTSTSTNGGAETSSHSTQTPSSSPSPAQPQNPLHAFIGSLMQSAFSSFLGTGGPQTPPATFTTPPRTSSNSNSTGGQTPGNNTAARQQSQIHHAASFTTNTGILGFPGIGNNNTGRSEGGVSAAANGFAFLHPNRPILRPLRQNGGNGNNGGSGNPGGDGRTPPRTSEIGRISLSRGGDPSSRQQSQTTPLQVGVRRTYDQRPRSTSPRVAVFSGGGANNAEGPIRRMRRLTPELHQQMFGEAPIHWNQASAHSQNVMFIGPRPPVNLPMYTMDPFLSCSSRRFRMFELDARHNDFWNDPLTVSLGLRPPPRSIASIRNSGDGQENINGNEQPGISSNSSPNSARARQNHGRTIIPRSNTNGEMVFTEQEDFQQYIYETLESVARCMTDIDTNISVQRRNQHPPPFNANTTVFGFVPMVHGGRGNDGGGLFEIGVGGGGGLPFGQNRPNEPTTAAAGLIEGIISVLASSSNEPTPPENAAEGTSSAGEGDGGQPSGEDNIQETQGNRSNNTGSEAMYDDPME